MSRSRKAEGPLVGNQGQEAAALVLAKAVVASRPDDPQVAALCEGLVGAAKSVDAEPSAALWREYREWLREVAGLGAAVEREVKLARLVALDGER